MTDATDGGGSPASRRAPSPVGFCPHCGQPLDARAFVQEYWTANVRRFHVWCDDCGHVFDVEPTTRVLTHEPAH